MLSLNYYIKIEFQNLLEIIFLINQIPFVKLHIAYILTNDLK